MTFAPTACSVKDESGAASGTVPRIPLSNSTTLGPELMGPLGKLG